MTAASTTVAAPVRRTLPVMRGLLMVFAALTALAVGALFVLADNTSETFAWTIQPPITAAFLGAGYAAGFVLVALSLRDPVWAHNRVPVLTIFVFVVLTLVATLVHVNKMHFDDDFGGLSFLAKAAAWFWLAVYVFVPVAMLVALFRQERAPGDDPAPEHPVPGALRLALGVESAVLLVVGALLFVAPDTATRLWPWQLTPFTGRVVAAWLLAFGLATALAAVAGDLERLRTAAIAYTVFGVLVLVTVARFSGSLDWDDPPTWTLLAVTGAMSATGALGWRLAPAPGRIRV
ncbi:hypothetical protein GCM10010531_05750 [Blastococcus jejuensis]|uniref:Uncharacterized protein n=1 Tax=Blastococcus jejuensis TaxID=351224 RepID=A0ABP6NTR2_9ACTN